MQKRIESIDGRNYKLSVIENKVCDPNVPRIIIPTYLPNLTTLKITQICIESIIKNTPESHEIWVIDNNSPQKHTQWLYANPHINVVFNRTEPRDPFSNRKSFLGRFIKRPGDQLLIGSYANALALELGLRCISPETRYVFTMHSDAAVVKQGWLAFFISKLNDKVKIAGYAQDPYRVQALHVAGLMVDYQIYKKLDLTFLPNVWQKRFPGKSSYDVGDQVTVGMCENGYDMYRCSNTYNTPELESNISDTNPFKALKAVTKTFDDEGDIIYLHLARGISKSIDTFSSEGKTSPLEWIDFAHQHILA